MLPASLAADVPVFIATPDVGLGERRRVVGAVAGHRDQPAALLLPLISASLSSGVASARKSSTPASSAIAFAVTRVVAGDHHGPDAHPAHLVEPLPHAGLDDVLEVDDAQRAGRLAVDVLGDHQRGAAGAADRVHDLADLLGRVAAVLAYPLHHRGGGALADPAAVTAPASTLASG